MVSVEKAVIARIHKDGKTFEILVEPEKALELKKGKSVSVNDIVAVNEVFKDAKKGERASSADLNNIFGTDDIMKVAEAIIKKGEIQLTTEQKRKLTEEKRKQIADIISRKGMNPQTKLPHPPNRILNAMEQAHISVDPFRPAESQVKDVVEKIRPIIPISFEQVEIAVKVPLQFAGRISSEIRRLATLKKEEWASTYWFALIEIPAGMQSEIYSRLNELTSGNVEVKVVGSD
jgi:ribosome maturation protein SDO1